MIKKYLKFSWKEKNKEVKSIIGILFDKETGFIKIRWLDRSALRVTEETVSLLKSIIENDLGVLKEKYIPSSHCQIIEKFGTSGCFDVFVINFPYYKDGFDYGYVSSEKIHVSMYKRLNEPVIFEGNVWNLIAIIERISTIVSSNLDFEEIKNLNVKEFTPWGESLLRNKRKEFDEESYEYEKF